MALESTEVPESLVSVSIGNCTRLLGREDAAKVRGVRIEIGTFSDVDSRRMISREIKNRVAN